MTRHIFTLPQILPKSVRLAGAEWRGRFTHMPIYGAKLRMTRHILADKWQPALFFPYLFLHRIAVSVEILHPETLASKFPYYIFNGLQKFIFALLTQFIICCRKLLPFWCNIALENPCEQVFSLTLYHKLLKKSVTFLVAFCSKTDFLLFFLKNTETQNYHTLEPHECIFLIKRQNNNTIIDL